MIAPCRECKARFVGCHARCEKYLAYRKERDKIAKAKMIEEATWATWRDNLSKNNKRSYDYDRNKSR